MLMMMKEMEEIGEIKKNISFQKKNEKNNEMMLLMLMDEEETFMTKDEKVLSPHFLT